MLTTAKKMSIVSKHLLGKKVPRANIQVLAKKTAGRVNVANTSPIPFLGR